MNSLQTRVLAALVLMSVVIVAAVGFQGYHCGGMAIMATMHGHVAAVAEARATLIRSWLEERSADMRELSVLPALLDGLANAAPETLDSHGQVGTTLRRWIEAAGEPYEDLAIFNASWEPIASMGSTGELHRAIVSPEIRRGLETGVSVQFGEAHLHEDRSVGVHVGAPIVDLRGKTVGYLLANLNMSESLTPLLQDRSGLMESGKAFVFDREFNVLTEPFKDRPSAAMRHQVNPFLGECVHDTTHGVHAYTDYLGHLVVGTARPLPLGDWAIGVEIDAAEALEWIRRLLFRALAMGATVVAGTVLVSLWLSRMLGRPLAQLAATAHRIAEGHTDYRLGTMSLPEAEKVRQAFNRMLDELQSKERELINAATLATVGELTSSVVHEMRNPLSSVKMNLQSLASLAKGSEENEELAQIAMAQVQRLETMLNELLHYGRPVELHVTKSTLTALVDEALELTKDAANRHGVAIEVDDHLNGQPMAVDQELISRALANLIRNAVQASPKGATVRIEACAAREDPGFIEISVADAGPGIRAEHVPRLFKPFFTTRPEGTGLGLANVKKIATLHRGDVFVGDGAGGGAVFTLRLPVSPGTGVK